MTTVPFGRHAIFFDFQLRGAPKNNGAREERGLKDLKRSHLWKPVVVDDRCEERAEVRRPLGQGSDRRYHREVGRRLLVDPSEHHHAKSVGKPVA